MSLEMLASWLMGSTQNTAERFRGAYGLQLYSLRHQLPGHVKPWLQRVRKMGYQEVEMAALYGLTVQQFHRALVSTGLRCVGMHNSFSRYAHEMPTVIREAKTLGLRYLICPELPQAGKHLTMADVRRAARGFNHFAAQLKPHGLRFGYHAEVNAFYPIGGRPGIDRLIALLRPDVIQEMDIFWYRCGGQNPVAYLRRYPKLFRLMHLKDMRRGTPIGDFNANISGEDCVPLGQGILHMRAILEEAAKIGVEHYFVEDESREAPQNILKDVNYLKTVRL